MKKKLTEGPWAKMVMSEIMAPKFPNFLQSDKIQQSALLFGMSRVAFCIS